MTCCKCGGENIHTTWISTRTHIEYDCSCVSVIPENERLHCYCRACNFEWAGEPKGVVDEEETK